MKRRVQNHWLRKLSALALCASLMCVTSFALAQDQELYQPPADEGSAEVQATEPDDQNGSDEASSDESPSESVFGQHTATLYRGRLRHR